MNHYKFAKPCEALPFREELVENLTELMKSNGYDSSQPITLWNGEILDGRHRYLASKEANVEPSFTEFSGTEKEAWTLVGNANVLGRRHLDSGEKQAFFAKRVKALGVRDKKDSLKQFSSDTPNGVTVPSQSDHAKDLGVHLNTVNRWEANRQAIEADPELKEIAGENYEEYDWALAELKSKQFKEEQEKKEKEASAKRAAKGTNPPEPRTKGDVLNDWAHQITRAFVELRPKELHDLPLDELQHYLRFHLSKRFYEDEDSKKAQLASIRALSGLLYELEAQLQNPNADQAPQQEGNTVINFPTSKGA